MALSVAVLEIFLAQATRGQTTSYTQTLVDLQAQYLGKAIKAMKPTAEISTPGSCNKTEVQPNDHVRAYECVIHYEAPEVTEAPAASGNKITSPPEATQSAQKQNQFSFYLDNDNVLLGLVPSGDDEGFTHRMGLAYLQQLPKDQSLQFDVMSEIYTKDAKPVVSQELEQMFNKGLINQIDRVYETGGKIPIHYVDVTRFKATYTKGDNFYFKAALGAEIRQTKDKDGKIPPAASIQNWWHNTLGIYTYKYVPSNGEAPVTQVSGKQAAEQVGYEENPNLAATSKVSALAEVAAGARIQLFEGKCTLQFEAGAAISTEGKKLVGPNSHLKAGGDLQMGFLKMKSGQPRIQTALGGAIFYFPSPQDQSVPKLGTQTQFEIASNHRVGKRGQTLQPFFTFWLPQGRQVFHNMNDTDLIQRMGIRFNFGNSPR